MVLNSDFINDVFRVLFSVVGVVQPIMSSILWAPSSHFLPTSLALSLLGLSVVMTSSAIFLRPDGLQPHQFRGTFLYSVFQVHRRHGRNLGIIETIPGCPTVPRLQGKDQSMVSERQFQGASWFPAFQARTSLDNSQRVRTRTLFPSYRQMYYPLYFLDL